MLEQGFGRLDHVWKPNMYPDCHQFIFSSLRVVELMLSCDVRNLAIEFHMQTRRPFSLCPVPQVSYCHTPDSDTLVLIYHAKTSSTTSPPNAVKVAYEPAVGPEAAPPLTGLSPLPLSVTFADAIVELLSSVFAGVAAADAIVDLVDQ